MLIDAESSEAMDIMDSYYELKRLIPAFDKLRLILYQYPYRGAEYENSQNVVLHDLVFQ